MVTLNINGKDYKLDIPDDTPLLWAIRDGAQLLGTKFACGVGECGSCTVLINGVAERSCVTKAADVQGKKITTIEGVPEDHPVKQAWIKDQVVQCGYCQPGIILQVASLLDNSHKPDAQEIIDSLDDVVCRCGTHARIKKGVATAVQLARKEG
jgi:isoquinoline 1-oxidoreductase subunit alpha